MSYKDIAFKVLKMKKKPLHCRKIVEIADQIGLMKKTEAKTPSQTMYAQLVRDINSKKQKSRFIQTGPSVFSLNPGFKEITFKDRSKPPNSSRPKVKKSDVLKRLFSKDQPLRAGRKKSGEVFHATLLCISGKVKYQGKERSPSGAGEAAAGQSTNGYDFWHIKNEAGAWITLNERIDRVLKKNDSDPPANDEKIPIKRPKLCVDKLEDMPKKFLIDKTFQVIRKKELAGKCGLYVLQKKNGKSIYIGKTSDMGSRLNLHIKRFKKIREWDKFSIYFTKTEEQAEALEAVVLSVLWDGAKPKENKQKPKILPKAKTMRERIIEQLDLS